MQNGFDVFTVEHLHHLCRNSFHRKRSPSLRREANVRLMPRTPHPPQARRSKRLASSLFNLLCGPPSPTGEGLIEITAQVQPQIEAKKSPVWGLSPPAFEHNDTQRLSLRRAGCACRLRGGKKFISVRGCKTVTHSIKPSLVREGGDHGAKRS